VALALDDFIHHEKSWPYHLNDIHGLRQTFSRTGYNKEYDFLLAISAGNEAEILNATPSEESWPYREKLELGSKNATKLASNLVHEDMRILFMLFYACGCNASKAMMNQALNQLGPKLVEQMGGAGRILLQKVKRTVQLKRPSPKKPAKALVELETFLRKHPDDVIKSGMAHTISCFLKSWLHERQSATVDQNEWFEQLPYFAAWVFTNDITTSLPAEARAERLQNVDPLEDPAQWVEFINDRVDKSRMSFEERVRLEITELKLLYHQVKEMPNEISDGVNQVFYDKFEKAFEFVQKGVPSEQKALTKRVEPLLLNFYVSSALESQTFVTNLALTEKLRRRHPNDSRLLALAFAGYCLKGKSLPDFAKDSADQPLSHFDADVFAVIAPYLVAKKNYRTSFKERIFDQLGQEQKKLALIRLFNRICMSAFAPKDRLRLLQELSNTFLAGDSFVYHDIKSGREIEKELIFYATLSTFIRETEILTLDARQWLKFGAFSNTIYKSLFDTEKILSKLYNAVLVYFFKEERINTDLLAVLQTINREIYLSLEPQLVRLLKSYAKTHDVDNIKDTIAYLDSLASSRPLKNLLGSLQTRPKTRLEKWWTGDQHADLP
jgi:hypothetical protein